MKTAHRFTACHSACLRSGLAMVLLAAGLHAQQATPPATPARPTATATDSGPKEWTTAADHQNMLDQLGIKSLRPGPSGNEQAPNHANYDEALANPFPILPDALTLRNGRMVATVGLWFGQRRKEIVEDFEREVYGRIPARVPKAKMYSRKPTERTDRPMFSRIRRRATSQPSGERPPV